MKEISYYDLLGMVKEGNAPKKIEVSLTYGTSREYNAEYDGDEFNYYRLDEDKLEDENYKDYLSECFLESSMFDKCITILDEEDEFEDIEEFQSFITNVGRVDESNIEEYIHTLFEQQTKLINNQKKIIKLINKD